MNLHGMGYRDYMQMPLWELLILIQEVADINEQDREEIDAEIEAAKRQAERKHSHG